LGEILLLKCAENFSEHNARKSSENSVLVIEKTSKTVSISLSYDVNDQVYSKSKPVTS